MRKRELRQVLQTVTVDEMWSLYQLYCDTDQEDRLNIVEVEFVRRENPRHHDKVVSPKIPLTRRLNS